MWVRKKQTRVYWEQNNGTLDYAVNPRPSEVRVHDMEGDVLLRYSGTIYGYNTTYGLVTQVQEYYDNSAIPANILRTTRIDYNLSGAYLTNRRIIGLVSQERVYDGPDEILSKLIAKTTYEYDRTGDAYLKHEGNPLHHVADFNTSYVPRGNLCVVERWNVAGGGSLESERGYNTSGVLIRTKDAAGHQSTISYTDNYAVGFPHGNTMAYPTRVTDGDGYVSRVQYDFDNGLVTQTRTPEPTQGANSEPQGATTTMSYDWAGRIKQVTQANGGYTKYEYPPNLGYIQRYTTLEDGQGEDYYIEFFDGAGRVRASGGYLDGSVGTWRGQLIFYNEVGRRTWVSNMTEINNDWVPVGDDYSNGWRWEGWEYDWRGRVTKEINADNTERTTSYGGCGCVGGQTVTTTDEVGRKREHVYNKLGLVYQTKVLNPGGSVYSTTTNTYNGRDQLTEVKEQVGESGTAQFTTFGYDGYGRLQWRQAPEQTSATTYSYDADDMVKTITDARGATQTFDYNGRHLPEAITYGAHGGAAATANVSIGYDALGNRDWMDDGPGYLDYVYDAMSRLVIESRWFDDLNSSYDISYTYNVGGQLKSITDPFGKKVDYQRDRMGRVTGATGTGYANWGTPVSQLASGIKYRAWGALKELTNGDAPDRGMFKQSYDARLHLTRFEAGGKVTEHDYHADGLVGYVRDLSYANFNRTYVYDHAGRLKEARAGEGAPYTNPYSYTYDYDVWGNTTGRLGTHWDRTVDYTTTYTNNRNQHLLYDAQGNVLCDQRYVCVDTDAYDAAGRKTKNRDLDQSSIFINTIYTYDGDGRQVRVSKQDDNGAEYSGNHYVRSTVLGGLVVAEMRSFLYSFNNYVTGKRERSYVYLNGEMLAYQRYGSPDDPELFRTMEWVYRNPVTGTNVEGAFVEQVIDPVGAEVGVSAPPPPPDPTQPTSTPLGSVTDFSVGCYLDGVETECSHALRMVHSGFANLSSVYVPGGVGGQVASGITIVEGYSAADRWVPNASDAGGTIYGSIGYQVVFSGANSFMSNGSGGRAESVNVTGGDSVGVAPQNPEDDRLVERAVEAELAYLQNGCYDSANQQDNPDIFSHNRDFAGIRNHEKYTAGWKEVGNPAPMRHGGNSRLESPTIHLSVPMVSPRTGTPYATYLDFVVKYYAAGRGDPELIAVSSPQYSAQHVPDYILFQVGVPVNQQMARALLVNVPRCPPKSR